MNITASTLQETNLQQFCALLGLGELSPEMVYLHAPDLLVTLDRDGTMAARLSLWWRHVPDYPGERLGLIGHYAAVDGEAASGILSAACSELAQHSCTMAVGPMDGSTWRRYRLLTERGSEPSFFLEPDNPDEWPRHFEAQGFTPLAHYYSALNDDTRHSWPVHDEAGSGVTIRHFELDQSERELDTLWQVAIHSFADNFLYTPIEKEEFLALYRPLLPLLHPELILFAEQDGKTVGFCFSLPDLLQARRGEPVDRLIIKTFAVLPEYRGHGLATLLIARANQVAARLGIRRSIHALMHESNRSRRIGYTFMRDFRRYILFARPL